MNDRQREMLKHTAFGIAVILMALVALDILSSEFPQSYQAAESFIKTYGLAGLFIIVFLGSSILPFPTDVSYAIAVKLFGSNLWPVFLTAVAAAFISSLINYWLAFYLREKFVGRVLSHNQLNEAKDMFDKYGPIPIVLFGVIPASPVFDPLTFVAGLVKMDFRKFAMYSLVSRILHFGLLAAGIVALKLF